MYKTLLFFLLIIDLFFFHHVALLRLCILSHCTAVFCVFESIKLFKLNLTNYEKYESCFDP